MPQREKEKQKEERKGYAHNQSLPFVTRSAVHITILY
jgi:hypothetical protein